MKVAEVFSFAIDEDLRTPFSGLLVVPDASVFRRGVYLWVAGVSGVVGGSGKTQVCLSVVQAVMVDMVHEHIVRDVYYESVHRYC